MTQPSRRVLELDPATDVEDPEVGRWITALTETRGRTHDALKDLSGELIDREPPGGSSIAAILYHLAIIEADWLYDDILDTQDTEWPHELFPAEVRDDGTHLTPFSGETLDEHLARLAKVRELLLGTIRSMSSDDLHELRERKNYDLSAAWALHHLMQHEAEHRSQIGSVREALGAGQEW